MSLTALGAATACVFCSHHGDLARAPVHALGQDPVVQSTGPQDARHQADLKRDAELGKKYSEQVEKESKLSEDKDRIARVQRIGAELAKIANENAVVVTWGDSRLNPFTYQFRVLKGSDVNAFSIPGGYIYVYEGLIDFAESDDELAGVLAHEIAHASFRHIATLEREANRLSVITLPLILAGLFAGGETGVGLFNLGQLVGVANQSGWSVRAEKSADYGGLQYMMKSEHNPVGMLTFMERLARRDLVAESFDFGIFRTHPPSLERATALKENLYNFGVPIRRSLVSSSFRVRLAEKDQAHEVWYQRVRIHSFAGPRSEERAVEAADRINAFLDVVPNLFEISAEGNQVLGRRRPLFNISAEDAHHLSTTPELAAAQVAQNLKRAAAALSLKVYSPS